MEKVRTKAADLTVDRRSLAELLGCSLRHVTELEAEGVFVALQRGRGGQPSTFALAAALPAYLRHVTQAPTSGAEREARRRRDMAQAQFVELKIAQAEGDLLPRDEVILAGQMHVKSWCAWLRALPRRFVTGGVLPREKERAAAEIIRELQVEISQWRPVKDGAPRKARA